MSIISVSNLQKFYKIHKKEPGLAGSVKSLFARKYEDVKAVDSISFNIEESELVGFIGPNGAGKTTTLKVLSGLLYPTSGKVSILGHEPWSREPVFQKNKPRLFLRLFYRPAWLWWNFPRGDFDLPKDVAIRLGAGGQCAI